jgi:hypothetical protein
MAGDLGIDNDFERLEIEPDKLGSVRGRLGALGNHERHGLTHKTDSLMGKRRPGEDLRHHLEADAGGKAEVGGGQHGHDARCSGGCCDIHCANRGVSQRRPHECHMKAVVLMEVVDEAAGACDQARILAPADGMTQNRAGHQGLHGNARVTCNGRCDKIIATSSTWL